MRTLDAVHAGTAQSLRDGGIETPSLDARLLVRQATGFSHEALIARGREAIAPDAAARLAKLISRRLDGEPVSRIKGAREFFGRDFLIDAHTLDPRPDTETLVEAALGIVAREGWQQRPLELLDLGTGSGCILLTLLAELPKAQGVGTDIGDDALQVARENARRLGLERRACFAAADWFEGLAGRFDLIVSNPPYIPFAEIAGLAREVVAYDPLSALDGGEDGLDAYRRIAARADDFLKPGGYVLVETGAGQANEVADLFRAAGLIIGDEGVVFDLAGRPRCLLAESPFRGATESRGSSKIGLENRGVQARFG